MAHKIVTAGGLVLYADYTPGLAPRPLQASHDSPQECQVRHRLAMGSMDTDGASSSGGGPKEQETPQLFFNRPLAASNNHNASQKSQGPRKSPSPSLLSSLFPHKGNHSGCSSSSSASDFSFGAGIGGHRVPPRSAAAASFGTPGACVSLVKGMGGPAPNCPGSPMITSPACPPSASASRLHQATCMDHSPAGSPAATVQQPVQEHGVPPAALTDSRTAAQVVPLVTQHMALELHEARRLCLVSRTWRDCWGDMAVDDVDVSGVGTSGQDAANHIRTALLSLSGKQRRNVKRLICSPALLSADEECFRVLRDCPNLAFLILSLPPASPSGPPQAQAGQGTEAGQPLRDAGGQLHSSSSSAGQRQQPLAGQQAGRQTGGVAGGEAEGVWSGLGRLLHCLPSLVCVDMSGCDARDCDLQVVASCCAVGGLRAIDLSYSPRITAAGVAVLMAECANLEELDISACPGAASDAVLAAIADGCPNLSSLYIGGEGDDAVGGVTVAGLGRLSNMLPSLDYLQVLGVRDKSTLAELQALAERHPHLQLVSGTPGGAGQYGSPAQAAQQAQPTTGGSAASSHSTCSALRDRSNRQQAPVAAGSSGAKPPGSSGKKAWKKLMSFLATETGGLALH